MSKDSKKPAIRFKGFTDDWEQRKFSEITETRRGLTYRPENVKESGIRVLRSSNINEDTFVFSNEDVFVEPSAVKIPLAKNGDILITSANGSSRLVGKHSIIRELAEESAVHGGFMLLASAEEPEFVNALMDSAWYIKFINTFVAGGNGAIGNLNKSDLDNQMVRVPSVGEQRKIGNLFKQIDNTITLHQRKLDKLKNIKKALLEKMFPRNGENIPEVRFKGFSDDWEQRKFGDVFNEYSEKKHPELPALTIIQGTGTILRDESDRKLQYDKASLVNYKLVNKDDLIVHLRSFEGGLEKANSEGIVSPAYHIFHGENTDTRFYYPFFRSRRFIDVLLKPHVYGIRDGKSIDIEGMKTISIPVPSYEEQEKVGDFIEKLDNLITLHQRKLDKLKNIKKALLEKMFV